MQTTENFRKKVILKLIRRLQLSFIQDSWNENCLCQWRWEAESCVLEVRF